MLIHVVLRLLTRNRRKQKLHHNQNHNQHNNNQYPSRVTHVQSNMPKPRNPHNNPTDHTLSRRRRTRTINPVIVTPRNEKNMPIQSHLLPNRPVNNQLITNRKNQNITRPPTLIVRRSINILSLHPLNNNQITSMKRPSKRMRPTITPNLIITRRRQMHTPRSNGKHRILSVQNHTRTIPKPKNYPKNNQYHDSRLKIIILPNPPSRRHRQEPTFQHTEFACTTSRQRPLKPNASKNEKRGKKTNDTGLNYPSKSSSYSTLLGTAYDPSDSQKVLSQAASAFPACQDALPSSTSSSVSKLQFHILDI